MALLPWYKSPPGREQIFMGNDPKSFHQKIPTDFLPQSLYWKVICQSNTGWWWHDILQILMMITTNYNDDKLFLLMHFECIQIMWYISHHAEAFQRSGKHQRSALYEGCIIHSNSSQTLLDNMTFPFRAGSVSGAVMFRLCFVVNTVLPLKEQPDVCVYKYWLTLVRVRFHAALQSLPTKLTKE